ncbi:MAG: hypothetical protein QM660_10980 [Dysgonomonas sp.]
MIIISIQHLENIIKIAKDNISKDVDLTSLIAIKSKENGGVKVEQLHSLREKKNKLIGF